MNEVEAMEGQSETLPAKGFVPVVEDVLDPDLQICDPHVHLFDNGVYRYLMSELRADFSSGHNISSSVYVQCGWAYRSDGPEHLLPVGETEYVVAADPEILIPGIVGFADLRSPDVEAVLEAHAEAGAGRFRGIRQSAMYDSSPDIPSVDASSATMFNSAEFRRGFGALGRAGLVFDSYMYHHQLQDVIDLARAQPDVPIVVDHLGAPLALGPYSSSRGEVMEQWRAQMHLLAQLPQVTLKLGGIGMPVLGGAWHHRPELTTSDDLADAWGPAIRWCIDLFGVDRCMFESNFPVDKASSSYRVLWNTFKRIVDDASASERAALFHDTAVRVYDIADGPECR